MSEQRQAMLNSPFNDGAVPLADAQRLSPAQLAIILEGMADCITVLTPAGQLIYANDEAARLIGYPDAEALLTVPGPEIVSQFETFDETGNLLLRSDLPSQKALRGIATPPQTVRFRVRATGEERWSMITTKRVCNEAGTLELVVTVFRDVTVLKQTELSERLLAAAGDALSGSLDVKARLRNVARLVVPDLADWCALDLLDDAGELQR
jgi:PAS domain S-box-containing protein